ncbi:ABC transporter permease [Parafrigoribacterium mesophilum]|uniref:ABC transporter permease n=1 Tax=Parafrigoribacterium mesophilum TaxID=433646 RepID=UPI0031FCA6DC
MSDSQLPVQGRTPDTESIEPGQTPAVRPDAVEDAPQSRFSVVLREITTGGAAISLFAVILALIAGAVLIAITDKSVQTAAGYFFSRPADTFSAIWNSVSGAYVSLFQGSVYNFRRPGFANGIRPFIATLTFATPLIAAGLGVAIGFRAGLFNIGGRGQMIIAAALAGWVGFSFDLPAGIHLVVALATGMAGAAIWSGLAGFLRATTGAHEVITTIMLNYVAFYFISYLLRHQGLLQAPGSNNPKSPAMNQTAVFPPLLGPRYGLTIGFLFVIAATVFAWWLLNRSNLGFQFRALGENPSAARVAGINVKRMYVYSMLIGGALVGLAGANQVQGVITTGFTAGIDAGIGFDAITVALLGRSRPWGVFAAGILFGAFKAGGFSMQAAQGIPVDIVLVVQSLIVLFIAAPPLVRAVFRLPKPLLVPRVKPAKIRGKKAVVTR